jgi:tetratricopeptide (TPR) repeat protein
MPDRPPAKSTRKVSQESNEMPAVKRGISHERDSSEGGPAQRKESEDRSMAARRLSSKINSLFCQCKWEQARNILEVAREQSPRDHWVLTQLGVTFYEQHKYEDALKLFLASRDIVDNCPLTLWNHAGTLDALGKHTEAMQIYTWLLQSNKSPDDDPCWESKEWTDGLKTDCVYRLGVCFRHLGKKQEAEHCFRQYVNLLLEGVEGTYSIGDVTQQIRNLQVSSTRAPARSELQRILDSTLRRSGLKGINGRSHAPPKFNEKELLPRRRSASKR